MSKPRAGAPQEGDAGRPGTGHARLRRAARRARGPRVQALAALVLGAVLPACSSDYKKLSSGGNLGDVLVYDLFGADRDPSYYFNLVKLSHDEEDFCYRCSSDPYIVDKNIDAIQRLGDAAYGRLEGQAQVILLLQEVLVEDRSPLARAAAATSLTKIGLKLPRYPETPVEDSGTRFLALAQELRSLYGDGRASPSAPPARQRALEVLRQLGDLRFPDLAGTKSALKEFSGRNYLVDERDPTLRAAIDTATVKRSDALVRWSLRAAVEDPDPQVRADAMRGVKTLADAGALPGVLARLPRETSDLVRLEAVEYLGRVPTAESVAALVRLLDEPVASVRLKARSVLGQVAGRDYGARRAAWEPWARARYPGIDLTQKPGEASPDDDASPPPPAGTP